MPEDADGQKRRTVVSSKLEAYFSDIFPHPSIIQGYQDAVPDGGKEVISIVKRQQLFTFIINVLTLLTNNFIPIILILPTIIAIASGAIIEITVISSIPIGFFTAGSAIGRVVTTWRGSSAEERIRLQEDSSAPPGQQQLPPESGGSQS